MAAYALMVEYKVEQASRELYTTAIKRLAEPFPNIVCYEGTDQPNLFVEIWSASTEEEAKTFQAERLSERSAWHVIGEYVAGGAAGIHAWTFKPI